MDYGYDWEQPFMYLSPDVINADTSDCIHYSLSIESQNLISQITSRLRLSYHQPVCGTPLIISEEADCVKLTQSGWSSIYVKKNLCNSLTSDLILTNETCLQFIFIDGESLRNIRSLQLNHNTELREFVMSDGLWEDEEEVSVSYSTEEVVLNGMIDSLDNQEIFLNSIRSLLVTLLSDMVVH